MAALTVDQEPFSQFTSTFDVRADAVAPAAQVGETLLMEYVPRMSGEKLTVLIVIGAIVLALGLWAAARRQSRTRRNPR